MVEKTLEDKLAGKKKNMADELITCPYNKFHQIRPSRIQYHLLKCKKVNRAFQITILVSDLALREIYNRC